MSFFFSPRKFSRRPSATTKISVHLVLILVVARKFLVHFSFSPLVTVHFFTTRLPRKKKLVTVQERKVLCFTQEVTGVCVCVIPPTGRPWQPVKRRCLPPRQCCAVCLVHKAWPPSTIWTAGPSSFLVGIRPFDVPGRLSQLLLSLTSFHIRPNCQTVAVFAVKVETIR